MTVTREAAARARAAAGAQRRDRPGDRRSTADPRYAIRSPQNSGAAATAPVSALMTVTRQSDRAASDGTALTLLDGYATVYETVYTMYDFFGPYDEVVSAGAGSNSLNRADLSVVFLLNHRGSPMAKTTIDTLGLSEEDHGLRSKAYVDERLAPEADLVARVERRLIDEMSFAFLIVRGMWSPDFTSYRIEEYDIHRGDTSAVTYGANPFTEIGVGALDSGERGRTLTAAERAAARRTLFGHLIDA